MARHGQTVMATAEVGEQGEVGMHLRQSQDQGQGPVTSAAREMVYGSLVFLAHAPSSFISDLATRTATEAAIRRVAEKPDPQARLLSVRTVTVSTSLLQDVQMGVKVDFTVNFRSITDQEAFTRTVSADGGKYMVRIISESVPAPNAGRCQQPLSLMSFDSDRISKVDQGQPGMMEGNFEVALSDGQLEITPSDQEEVARDIAQEAGVDRAKVVLTLIVPGEGKAAVYFSLASAAQELTDSATVLQKMSADVEQVLNPEQ